MNKITVPIVPTVTAVPTGPTMPVGEQIRFLSARTGAWVLDTYIETAELGNRTVADLLADLFDGQGNLIVSGLSNWRGFWQSGVQYRSGDTMKDPNGMTVYVALNTHTSNVISSDLSLGHLDTVIVAAGVGVGVVMWNTRGGYVTMNSQDITDAGPNITATGSLIAGGSVFAGSTIELITPLGADAMFYAGDPLDLTGINWGFGMRGADGHFILQDSSKGTIFEVDLNGNLFLSGGGVFVKTSLIAQYTVELNVPAGNDAFYWAEIYNSAGSAIASGWYFGERASDGWYVTKSDQSKGFIVDRMTGSFYGDGSIAANGSLFATKTIELINSPGTDALIYTGPALTPGGQVWGFGTLADGRFTIQDFTSSLTNRLTIDTSGNLFVDANIVSGISLFAQNSIELNVPAGVDSIYYSLIAGQQVWGFGTLHSNNNFVIQNATTLASWLTITTAGAVAIPGTLSVTGQTTLANASITGTATAVTQPTADNSTKLATTAFVKSAASAAGVASFNTRTGAVTLTAADITGAGGALLASPALSGTPTAPTAAPGTSTTQIATTAFVGAAAAAPATVAPLMNGVAAVGTSLLYARQDHKHPTDTSLAPLASPTFTGTPAAPTAAPGTATTQLATTAFVNAAVGGGFGVVSFNTRTGAVVLTTADITAAGGAPIVSPVFTGTPSLPTGTTAITQTVGDNSAKLATTSFVQNAVSAGTAGVVSFNSRTGTVVLLAADITAAGGALLASPTFSGTPTAPTVAVDTNTTQLATTAFVLGQASSVIPLMDGTAAIGTATRFARSDHVHPRDTGLLPLTGGSLAGPGNLTVGGTLSVTAASTFNATVFITKAAGSVRTIQGQTAGVARWNFIIGNGTAEGGANSGSDFALQRCTDAGAIIDTPVTITRSTGQVTITGGGATTPALMINGPTVATGSWIAGSVAGSHRWDIFMANGAAETGGNVGSDFGIYRYADNGVLIGAALTIMRSTGAVIINNNVLNIAGPTVAGGAVINSVIAGKSRWGLYLGNGVAETGGNAGNDLEFACYNDAGAYLNSPIQVSRATGMVVLTQATIINAGVGLTLNAGTWPGSGLVINTAAGRGASIQGSQSAKAQWQVWVGNGTPTTGGNVGNDFEIDSFNDAGVAISTVPLTIKRSTGVTTFGAAIVNGPSDRTLKGNIEPLTGGLDKILALQGVSFHMLTTPDKREIGLIAQDVGAVVPEVIQPFEIHDRATGETATKLALDYSKLVAVLIEAVKELSAKVAALEART